MFTTYTFADLFPAVDLIRLINSILFREKIKKEKTVIKISSPNAVCEPRCNAKD